MKYLICIISIMFISFQFAFCAKVVNANNKPKVDVLVNADSSLSEAKAYKMLYDNEVRSSDSILNTIYYALGGLGTAVLLVLASNWWFNEKKVRDVINDIDKKIVEVKIGILSDLTEKINVLTNEKSTRIDNMQQRLQEEVTASITSITLKHTEFTEKIRAEIKEDNSVLVKNYQKQLETFNDNYRQQLLSLTDSISTISSDMKEQLNERDTSLKGLISIEKQSIFTQLNLIKQKISRNSYYLWDSRGVQRNAFNAQLEELESMMESPTFMNKDFSFYLQCISDTVDKLKESFIYPFDKDLAIKLLTKLPAINQELAQQILTKLEDVKIS